MLATNKVQMFGVDATEGAGCHKEFDELLVNHVDEFFASFACAHKDYNKEMNEYCLAVANKWINGGGSFVAFHRAETADVKKPVDLKFKDDVDFITRHIKESFKKLTREREERVYLAITEVTENIDKAVLPSMHDITEAIKKKREDSKRYLEEMEAYILELEALREREEDEAIIGLLGDDDDDDDDDDDGITTITMDSDESTVNNDASAEAMFQKDKGILQKEESSLLTMDALQDIIRLKLREVEEANNKADAMKLSRVLLALSED